MGIGAMVGSRLSVMVLPSQRPSSGRAPPALYAPQPTFPPSHTNEPPAKASLYVGDSVGWCGRRVHVAPSYRMRLLAVTAITSEAFLPHTLTRGPKFCAAEILQ